MKSLLSRRSYAQHIVFIKLSRVQSKEFAMRCAKRRLLVNCMKQNSRDDIHVFAAHLVGVNIHSTSFIVSTQLTFDMKHAAIALDDGIRCLRISPRCCVMPHPTTIGSGVGRGVACEKAKAHSACTCKKGNAKCRTNQGHWRPGTTDAKVQYTLCLLAFTPAGPPTNIVLKANVSTPGSAIFIA